MRELSELDQRILSELDEAGREDVPTMMLTTMAGTGEPKEVHVFKSALERLVLKGLVRMSIDADPSQKLRALSELESLAVVAALSEHFQFDAGRANWRDTRHVGPPFCEPFPFIVATEDGKNLALKVLQQRGYKWWAATKR